MVFSSIDFLLRFLPVFILLYYITPKSCRNLTLLAGSILFYAQGEPGYVFLLLASVMVNFAAGERLDIKKPIKRKKKKAIYIAMVVADVLMLVFFKVMPQTPWVSEGMSLPLGISFYTFQILSYLTDVYRGDVRADKSFVRLATYISMFPQLVAGPIVNYKEVATDLRARSYTLANVDKGLKTLCWDFP